MLTLNLTFDIQTWEQLRDHTIQTRGLQVLDACRAVVMRTLATVLSATVLSAAPTVPIMHALARV